MHDKLFSYQEPVFFLLGISINSVQNSANTIESIAVMHCNPDF